MPMNLTASGSCCSSYISKAKAAYSKVSVTLNANGGKLDTKSGGTKVTSTKNQVLYARWKLF